MAPMTIPAMAPAESAFELELPLESHVVEFLAQIVTISAVPLVGYKTWNKEIGPCS